MKFSVIRKLSTVGMLGSLVVFSLALVPVQKADAVSLRDVLQSYYSPNSDRQSQQSSPANQRNEQNKASRTAVNPPAQTTQKQTTPTTPVAPTTPSTTTQNTTPTPTTQAPVVAPATPNQSVKTIQQAKPTPSAATTPTGSTPSAPAPEAEVAATSPDVAKKVASVASAQTARPVTKVEYTSNKIDGTTAQSMYEAALIIAAIGFATYGISFIKPTRPQINLGQSPQRV